MSPNCLECSRAEREEGGERGREGERERERERETERERSGGGGERILIVNLKSPTFSLPLFSSFCTRKSLPSLQTLGG